MSNLKIIEVPPPKPGPDERGWEQPHEGTSLVMASDVETRRVFMVAQPVLRLSPDQLRAIRRAHTRRRVSNSDDSGAWRLWAAPAFLVACLVLAAWARSC